MASIATTQKILLFKRVHSYKQTLKGFFKSCRWHWLRLVGGFWWWCFN